MFDCCHCKSGTQYHLTTVKSSFHGHALDSGDTILQAKICSLTDTKINSFLVGSFAQQLRFRNIAMFRNDVKKNSLVIHQFLLGCESFSGLSGLKTLNHH